MLTLGLAGILSSQSGTVETVENKGARIDIGLRNDTGPMTYGINIFADGLFDPAQERYGVEASIESTF